MGSKRLTPTRVGKNGPQNVRCIASLHTNQEVEKFKN